MEPSSSFDLLASICSPVAVKGVFLSNLILKNISSHLRTLQPHYTNEIQCILQMSVGSRFHIQLGMQFQSNLDQRNCLTFMITSNVRMYADMLDMLSSYNGELC